MKQTITMFKNKHSALFLIYRNKPESQTRYWRKLEAQQKFLCNLEIITGEYEKSMPKDPTWQAFLNNRYQVLYVLVHLIKTLEVCFIEYILFLVMFFIA